MNQCIIVEDADLVREVACAFVQELKLEAHPAKTPKDALKLFSYVKARLVLLDWDLPGHGALEVLTALAELSDDERPRVILLMAEHDSRQFALAQEAGVTDYVLKPIDNTLLTRAIDRSGCCSSEVAA